MTEAWMIPNIPGLGGSPFFATGGGGLSNAQAQYNQNQGYFGDQSRTLGAAQVPQSQLYGGGSFGAQPAAYAAAGAAYGRAVAPSSKAAVAAEHGTPPSVFDTGAAPVPYSPPPGSFSPSPNYPGRGGSSVFETGAPPVPYQNSPPMGSFSPSPNYPGGSRNAITQAMMPPAPNFNDTFSQFRSGGDPTATQMQNQPAINAVNQMSLGGRFNPRVPSSPPPSEAELGGTLVNGGPQGTGWTPDFQGPGDENSFANRFGFRNAGTPSEYTTAPYTDVGGTTRGPMQMPSGFSTPYSFDNPGGALGRGGFQGTQALIMGNSGWEPGESADTLTSRDRTAPGGFYGSAFDPAQFQPSGGAGRGSIGGAGGMGSVAAFNSYGLPGGGGMGAFGGRGSPTTGIGSIGAAPGDMSNFVSPSNNYNTFQRGASYPWTQQVPGNDPNIMNAVYGAAGKVGSDPAALAGMINTESRWNPQTSMGSYFGATQMGPDTFREAGGRLGGMTFDQYKNADLAAQIGAYPEWQRQYNIPAKSEAIGFGSQSPPVQAALLQAFQFAPNASGWQRGFAGGNTSLPVTTKPQADVLSYVPNTPPTVGSMTDYYRGTMGRGR